MPVADKVFTIVLPDQCPSQSCRRMVRQCFQSDRSKVQDLLCAYVERYVATSAIKGKVFSDSSQYDIELISLGAVHEYIRFYKRGGGHAYFVRDEQSSLS